MTRPTAPAKTAASRSPRRGSRPCLTCVSALRARAGDCTAARRAGLSQETCEVPARCRRCRSRLCRRRRPADQVLGSRQALRGDVHVFWKLDLQLEYNSGSSFSLAQGWAPVIAATAVVIVAVLVVMVRNARSNGVAVALGLVIGGALGNLSDRVFRSHHGSVVDFIALHFWPTFNVADSCVVIGSILLVLLLWRSPPSTAQG